MISHFIIDVNILDCMSAKTGVGACTMIIIRESKEELALIRAEDVFMGLCEKILGKV